MPSGSRLLSTRQTQRRASGARNDRPAESPFRARLLRQQSSSLASRSRYLAEAGTEEPQVREGAAYAMAGALQPFDTCDSVLAYFKDQAPEYLIQRVGGGAVPSRHRRRRIGDRTYGT